MLALFPVCLEDPVEDVARGVQKTGVDAPFSDEGLALMQHRHRDVVVYGSNAYRFATSPRAFVDDEEAPTHAQSYRSLARFLEETLTPHVPRDRAPPAMVSAEALARALGATDPEWARVAEQLAAAIQLVEFMSDCSEERICAGWEFGNGVTLWRQYNAREDEEGMSGAFTEDDRNELGRLAEAGGFWWEWFEGREETPVPLEDWRRGRVCMTCGHAAIVRLPGANDETYAACAKHLRDLAWYVRYGADALVAWDREAWFRATLPPHVYDSFGPALRALVTETPDFGAAGLLDVDMTHVELDPAHPDGLSADVTPDAVCVTYVVNFRNPRGFLDAWERNVYRLPFRAENDPAAVWESLATRGVIPFEWADASPARRFECPACHGVGIVGAGGASGDVLQDADFCEDCAREDLQATGGVRADGTLAHPPSFAAAFAVASSCAGIARAEMLARDFYRHVCALEPAREGLQGVLRMRAGVVPVVWRVGPCDVQRMVRRQDLHFAMMGLSAEEGAAFDEALLPAWLWLSPGSPLLAPCLEGTDRAREAVPHPLRRLYDRMNTWPESLGPNPWTPLYTLWAEGFRFEKVAPGGLYLALDGFPIARDPRSNGAHG